VFVLLKGPKMNPCAKCKTAPRKENDSYCILCRREISRQKSAERRKNGKYSEWLKQNPNYSTEYSREYYYTMSEEQRAKHREQQARYEQTPARKEQNRINARKQREKRKDTTK